MRTNIQRIGEELKTQAYILGGFIVIFWVVEFIDWILPFWVLDNYGVRPQSLEGLRGIIFGPFLHGGFDHVFANTVPFIVLGWLILVRSLRDFVVVTCVTAVISGLGIWLIADPRTVHIGASGLIFGYFGYLLFRTYFERSFGAILVTFIVVMSYGSLIFGVLPQAPGISWQAHLFGFIGGGLSAYLLAPQRNNNYATVVEPETAVPLEDTIKILE